MGLLACSALLKGLHVSTFLGRACLDFCMSVRPEDVWPAPQLLVSPDQVHLKGAAVQTHQRLCQLNAGWSSALALFVMVLPPSMPCLLLPHTQVVVALAAGKSKLGKARWVKVDLKRKRDEDMNALRAARLRQRSVSTFAVCSSLCQAFAVGRWHSRPPVSPCSATSGLCHCMPPHCS